MIQVPRLSAWLLHMVAAVPSFTLFVLALWLLTFQSVDLICVNSSILIIISLLNLTGWAQGLQYQCTLHLIWSRLSWLVLINPNNRIFSEMSIAFLSTFGQAPSPDYLRIVSHIVLDLKFLVVDLWNLIFEFVKWCVRAIHWLLKPLYWALRRELNVLFIRRREVLNL